MSKSYFIADTHFGHNREFVYEARGCKSIDEHDSLLIEGILGTVNHEDKLYILGDLYFNDKYENILIKLNRNICVIQGNHDKSLYKNHNLFDNQRIKLVGHIYDTKINKTNITMSHYPMMSWNMSHYGAWNLYGHVHGKKLPICGKQFDCQPTANHMKPWSYEELIEIMETKPKNWDYIERN